MGTLVRLFVEADEGNAGSAAAALRSVEELLRRIDRELTRFSDASELARLNASPAAVVPASSLLRLGVEAATEAATGSDGVLDPTVIGALERVGYDESRRDQPPESLREAVRLAPPRHPARPNRASRWPQIAVDHERGTISRPPGVRVDLGGVGKGLAADLAAAELAGFRRFAVDCGGDLALGGVRAGAEPWPIGWEDPFSGEIAATLEIGSGGLATSGIETRLWRHAGGRYGHHLIDPSSGDSAWTGVVAATAQGRTALEAETLSKLALLSGPEAGREILAEQGGLLVLDSGEAEAIGPLRIDWA